MAVRRFNPETIKEIRKTPSVVVVGLWVENFAVAFRRSHAKRADLPSLLIAEDALRSYIHVMADRIGSDFAAKLGHSVAAVENRISAGGAPVCQGHQQRSRTYLRAGSTPSA